MKQAGQARHESICWHANWACCTASFRSSLGDCGCNHWTTWPFETFSRARMTQNRAMERVGSAICQRTFADCWRCSKQCLRRTPDWDSLGSSLARKGQHGALSAQTQVMTKSGSERISKASYIAEDLKFYRPSDPNNATHIVHIQ